MVKVDYSETNTVIARLESYSFTIRGWAVSTIAAIAAVAVTTGQSGVLLIAALPTVFFWGLDTLFWKHQSECARHKRHLELVIDQLLNTEAVDASYSFGHGKALHQTGVIQVLALMLQRRIMAFYLGLLTVVPIGMLLMHLS